MLPLVSVIIPVYRDWARLALCLNALANQTLPASNIEIIIANNEPDGEAPHIRLPENARIVHERRPGSYAARNTAIAAAAGEYLAFTDSDCIPSPAWLGVGLGVLRQMPGARVTGPVSLFRESGAGRLAHLYEFHTAFKQDRLAARGRCATANLIVARAAFDAVGKFNERLVSGGDAEWGDRAHRAGIPIIYDESVLVLHPSRKSIAEIIKKRRRLAGSTAKRKEYSTYKYFLLRLLPPFRNYLEFVLQSGRGKIGVADKVKLFFVHWTILLADGVEFLAVRRGWKGPNRS